MDTIKRVARTNANTLMGVIACSMSSHKDRALNSKDVRNIMRLEDDKVDEKESMAAVHTLDLNGKIARLLAVGWSWAVRH